MSVSLLNYAISRDHIASVHRTGCKDIERDANEHGALVQEFETVEAALADYVDGEMAEMGYSAADVHVYPCAKGL
jgi:hypothetical protein